MLKRRQNQLSKECTCGDLQLGKLLLFVILKYFMNPITIIQNLASIGKIEVLLRAGNGSESITMFQVKAHKSNQLKGLLSSTAIFYDKEQKVVLKYQQKAIPNSKN